MSIWDELKYFKKNEFVCPESGEAPMNHAFLKKLDHLRERCGFAFIITSGYRSPDYNEKISSTGRNGPHTTGRAADILVKGKQAHELIKRASPYFTGIGVAQKGPHGKRFIHLDDLEPGTRGRPTIWSY